MHTPDELIPAYFSRLSLELTPDDAAYGAQPGDASERIDALLTCGYIRDQIADLDPDAIAAELAAYGAWDNSQLADPDANAARLLWLACCDITKELANANA